VSHIRERAQNAKQDLFETFPDEPDSLTKSVAENVIAPMLEPPDKQPSWELICETARKVLNDALDTLNGYKKTVTKAATPLLSFLRPKTKSTCILSTLATDGSRSDDTKIFVLSLGKDPDGLGVVGDECHKDANIEPNISMEDAGYSYCLERYLRDKSDCRYLFPARGYNAAKELDKIYLEDMIERFERMFIDAK